MEVLPLLNKIILKPNLTQFRKNSSSLFHSACRSAISLLPSRARSTTFTYIIGSRSAISLLLSRARSTIFPCTPALISAPTGVGQRSSPAWLCIQIIRSNHRNVTMDIFKSQSTYRVLVVIMTLFASLMQLCKLCYIVE